MTDRRSSTCGAPLLRLCGMLALLCGGLLAGIPGAATAQGVNYLYFLYGMDGAYPYAGLIQGSDGYLYGTTRYGGTSGDGTVFQITTSGLFNSLHSFTTAWGYRPFAPLLETSDGKLVGTTANDSALDQGTLFQVNKLPVSLFVGARTDTTIGQPITFRAYIARRWDGKKLLGKRINFKVGSIILGTGISNDKGTPKSPFLFPILSAPASIPSPRSSRATWPSCRAARPTPWSSSRPTRRSMWGRVRG